MFSIGLFLRVVISRVRPGGSVVSASDSWPGGCEFDPQLRRLFFPAYFRLSPLQKHVRKVVGGFGKKSSVSTGVRKPGNTCVTDRHDMTLAVKVALNPNTTNQRYKWGLYGEGLRHLKCVRLHFFSPKGTQNWWLVNEQKKTKTNCKKDLGIMSPKGCTAPIWLDIFLSPMVWACQSISINNKFIGVSFSL